MKLGEYVQFSYEKKIHIGQTKGPHKEGIQL